MWFDLALRLAYPGTRLAGIYYYDDGRPGPSRALRPNGDGWTLEAAFPALLKQVPARDAVVLTNNGHGLALAASVPDFVCGGRCGSGYQPENRIEPGPPSAKAVNRYGPL